MRVLLKKNDLYLKIAWITRLGNGSLIGWHLNNEEFIKNFPPGIKSFEIHYHYPIKGKFHYSYKYKIGEFKYEIRAYKDHLSTKVIGNIYDITKYQLFLPEFKNFTELFLIENSDEIDLNSPELVKQISSVGFNIWTDKVLQNIKDFGSQITLRPTDIVLDVDVLGRVCISCSVLIYNNPKNVSLKGFENSRFIRMSNYESNPSIELIVGIIPSD